MLNVKNSVKLSENFIKFSVEKVFETYSTEIFG